MLFNSYEFIFVFLPITLLIYYLIAKWGHYRFALYWLILASLFFYGWWNPVYLLLIMGSILFNYFVGLALSNPAIKQNRRHLLITGIIINLALIAYFKYANFFVDSINIVTKTSIHLDTIILPLAISFFTFQQIAYLVDAYRGETKEYDFVRYCLFITFFPQLIAGPIVHHKEVIPQFANTSIYTFNYSNLSIGLSIFLLGLFKKVVLADSVALYATPVFDAANNGDPLSFFVAWGGALSYTFQLYFDFSGYSDMAIGLARMFGINLPMNFCSPYKSVNIIEFWHRWHITLSSFLKNYLYIPLGGNKHGKSQRYLNLMLTMLLGGLWHGAGWTFVAWGALHGFYLLVNHAWRSLRVNLGADLSKRTTLGIVLSTGLTFLAVLVSWVFFRAETFASGIAILDAMLNFQSTLGLTFKTFAKLHLALLIILFFIVLALPNTEEFILNQPSKNKHFMDWVSKGRLNWQPSTLWAFFAGAMFTFTLFLLERESEFLYFQF